MNMETSLESKYFSEGVMLCLFGDLESMPNLS